MNMSVRHIEALYHNANPFGLERHLHCVSNPLCYRPEVLIYFSWERPQRVNLLLRHDQYMAIT